MTVLLTLYERNGNAAVRRAVMLEDAKQQSRGFRTNANDICNTRLLIFCTTSAKMTALSTIHPSYNFEDADFTIRVELPSIAKSAVTTTDYRVHRDKLAAHSPVFADMFAVGDTSTTTTQSIQDIVHVQAKAAQVWPIMLASIYNSFELLSEDSLARLSLTGLLALIEDTHKYHLVTLHRLCSTKLE